MALSVSPACLLLTQRDVTQLMLLSVSRQIGEGGYAFVYLAKELPTAGRPIASAEAVAIKKVISTLYAHVVDRELLYAPIFAVKSEKDINRSVYLCGAVKVCARIERCQPGMPGYVTCS